MKRTGAKHVVQKLNQKLRSRSGASLMMGLLTFLICAVLGSVVLVAGTASAGRLSELADSEQRYYAVNSAAGLLREQLCSGEAMVFKRTKTTTGETSTYKLEAPTAPADTDPGAKLRYLFACYRVFGTAAPPETASEAMYIYDSNKSPSQNDSELPDTINLTVTAESKEELEVEVKAEMKANGQLVLTLNNKKGDDKYKLRMTFATNSIAELSTSKTESAGVITKNETKTNTIQWSLGSVVVVEEAPAATPEGGGD